MVLGRRGRVDHHGGGHGILKTPWPWKRVRQTSRIFSTGTDESVILEKAFHMVTMLMVTFWHELEYSTQSAHL